MKFTVKFTVRLAGPGEGLRVGLLGWLVGLPRLLLLLLDLCWTSAGPKEQDDATGFSTPQQTNNTPE